MAVDITLSISKEYGYVLLVASLIALQLAIHGFRYAGGARRRVFTSDFYKKPEVKALLEEHKKEFKEDKLPNGGYPDMGNGRYSDLLSYGDWYRFNTAQRAHLNGVELIASVLVWLLISGLQLPKFTTGAGVLYLVGREIYAYGYASKGPSGRTAGAVFADIALLLFFGGSVATALHFAELVTVPKF